MKIVCFGAGDMWEKGIKPVVGGVGISHEKCDVLKARDVGSWINSRKPDVVIVTAGVSQPGSLTTYSWDNHREVEVNLIGSMNVAWECVLRKVKTVIFIGSVAGKYGKPNHAAYCASKAGVISLTQSLAMEGHNAYCISPGRVDTKLREKDYPDDKEGSREDPRRIGCVVKDILDGKYEPGDNIIVRRIGYKDAPIVVDKGDGWKEILRVGEPKTI